MFPAQVSLIVMLTKLVEVSEAGNRRPKADQYWPNQEQENLVFPRSGLRVEQIRHRDLNQGNYIMRQAPSNPLSTDILKSSSGSSW